MSLSKYQKHATLAYGRKKSILPQDLKDQIADLITQSNRANTLLNQIAKHANTHHVASLQDLEEAVSVYRQ